MRIGRSVALLAVLSVLSNGCGRDVQNWQFQVTEKEGNTVLDTDRVTIVFEGVPCTSPGASGTLPVAGGSIGVKISGGSGDMNSSYSGGVNTITIAGHTLTVSEGGTRLTIGPRTFELGPEKRTIVVKKDGTASAQ
jgi:hypothetical protein